MKLTTYQARVIVGPEPLPMVNFIALLIGRWMLFKYARRVDDSDVFTVAKRLRKDGVPLPLARLILLRKL